MTSQHMLKHCDGGHTCMPPKECCKQGCCFPPDFNVYRPPVLPAGNMFSPLFLGHWYFWAAITATVAGILCACSLWRRHTQTSFCCRDSNRDERVSEPDSNGSCYIPPQYSRCSSFHQAPPPYSEVTSKPDLYPLVISCNGDTTLKSFGNSTGYLMVQYFRNFIVRPVGTLSATSTIDSLSSSFICNASNEANTIIPPPYSCTGSLEEVTIPNTNNTGTLTVPTNQPSFPRSASSLTCTDLQVPQQASPANSSSTSPRTKCSELLIRSNPCYVQNATNYVNSVLFPATKAPSPSSLKIGRKLNFAVLAKEVSVDSESQEDEHNFSDLLNLSVCAPNLTMPHANTGTAQNSAQHSYSVTNSMTSSDISSLANLGTPDSPPRATSPTLEMKELLDKIQQLPEMSGNNSLQKKSYFSRAKAKTLYMPLNEDEGRSKFGPRTAQKHVFVKTSWLSRSAPNTPCGNMVPAFPGAQKKSGGGSQKGSKVRISDGSPLLHEQEESDEDQHRDECL